MDIKISLVLKDEVYGFSDLLDGRELNDQTKKEIIELIKEDVGFAFDQQIEVEELNVIDDDKGWIYCPNCGRVKEDS